MVETIKCFLKCQTECGTESNNKTFMTNLISMIKTDKTYM